MEFLTQLCRFLITIFLRTSAHALKSTLSWISAHPLGYNIKQTLPLNKPPPLSSPYFSYNNIRDTRGTWISAYYWQGLKDDEINNACWYISVLSVQWDYGMLDYEYCYNKHKTVKIWQKHCYTSFKEKLNKCPSWLRVLLPKSTHPFSCHFK